ncbi:hypothetical protein DFH06DRAFT_1314196 [Mycena polygramma]|nr:hypothetical protein DFH06DRAFT_1314196 [Mycena polygramma]
MNDSNPAQHNGSQIEPHGQESTKEPVWKDWYTTPEPLPEFWSCDWRKWRYCDFFEPLGVFAPFQGDTRIGAVVTLNIGYGIPGTIEPLAFLVDGCRDFLFIADGVYYAYSVFNELVYRYDQETYTSHLDCIWRSQTEPKHPRTDIPKVRPWPYGTGYTDNEGNLKMRRLVLPTLMDKLSNAHTTMRDRFGSAA